MTGALWSELVVSRPYQRPRRDILPGGAKGTRTPDPLLAKQVLFQLSYSPAKPQVTRPIRDPSIHGQLQHPASSRRPRHTVQAADAAGRHRTFRAEPGHARMPG
jgi:hypothetical protein